MDEAEKERLIDQAVITPDVVKKSKIGIFGYNILFFLVYISPVFIPFLIGSPNFNVAKLGWSFEFMWKFYFSSIPALYIIHQIVLLGLMIMHFFKSEKRKGFDYLFTFLFLLLFFLPIMFIGFVSQCTSGC